MMPKITVTAEILKQPRFPAVMNDCREKSEEVMCITIIHCYNQRRTRLVLGIDTVLKQLVV